MKRYINERMLHEKLTGRTPKVSEVLLSTELVIRGSTEHD